MIIVADHVKRVFANIDADHAIALSRFWDMACSLFLAPLPSILSLVGQEHGRTIPFADLLRGAEPRICVRWTRHSPPGEAKMQQRGRSGRPVKGRRPNRPKARKVSVAAPSVADLKKKVSALTSELGEAGEQQTATAEVLQIINSSRGNLAPVFDGILQRAIHLCEASFGNLWLYDGKKFDLAAAQGPFPLSYLEMLSQAGQYAGPKTAMRRAVSKLKPIHIADYQLQQAYVDRDPVAVATAEVGRARTILAVPMVGEARALGVFFLYRHEVWCFSKRQIALLQNFAAQAVIAIENARLFNEVQAKTHDLEQSLQQQTATADVLKVISRSAFDLQAVLHTLVESAARLSGANQGTITRQKGGKFYRVESFNHSREFMDYVRDIPVTLDRGSASGRALLAGDVVHITDVLADPEYTFKEAQRLSGLRTCLGVPVLREGIPVGVISLTRSEVSPFTDKQIELVKTFADQAAIAIENARLFEEVQARTRELAKSLDDLRAAQDRLIQTEKLASLGQLTAGIAHEIKNPLNFVNNFAALSVELTCELKDALKPVVLDETIRAEVDEISDLLKNNLDKVVQHGKRADSIVKNMLLHSREGSGEQRSADINAIVEDSLNLAYHGARAEKSGFEITLQRDFDANAGKLELFPQEISRALINLISNGFYAATKQKAEKGGAGFEPTVLAATKDLGDSVEVRIRDNGAGIPPKVREKMFNPFFTTKPTGEGTGLGLSMTHDIIVKQHGGRIDVETRLGEFTEFIITLPRNNRTAGG
jgi:two-component system NtrC family sensor kinase